jgi:O-antigen/teichoic acid export membrane protein
MKKIHILIKNITSNFFAQLWLMLISFFATPIILKNLGESRYGILIILNIIPNYLSVLDFGIVASLIKNISEYNARSKKLTKLISNSLILYTVITFLLCIILFLFSETLSVQILKIPSNLVSISIISIKLVAISFFLSSLATFFSTIPQALQRFEIYNLKNLIIGTILPIGTILLLYLNKDLKDIIYLYIFTHALTLLVFVYIFKKMVPYFKLNFKLNKPIIKKLFSFGKFKFISNLNSRIVFQFNHFIIGAFLPISHVGYYSIPAGLTQKAVSILPNITSPVFPLSSELSSLAENIKIRKLYKKSVKLSNFIMIPVFIFIFFSSYTFLSLWIDESFANQASLILQILSISYLLASFSAVPVAIIEGLGLPKISAFFSTISAILFILFSLILVPNYGIIGAAVSVLLNRIIQVPIFILYVNHKILNLKYFKYYFNNYIKIFIISLFAALLTLTIFKNINALIHYLFVFGLYLICFVLLSLLTKVINSNDIKTLRNFKSKA